jgi:hypothetical protein
MKRLPLLLVPLLALALQASARATQIVDLTTGTVLFSDDFEGVSPVSSSPAIDSSGTYHAVAETGTWQIPGTSSSFQLQVTNSTTSPDPGPFQGNNYFRGYRDSTHTNESEIDALMTAPATTTGDVIEMSTMLYLQPGAPNARVQIIMSGSFTGGVNTSTSADAWIRPNGAGDVAWVGPGTVVTNTSVPYTTGVWQLWKLDYTVGSSVYSFSVDGVSSGNLTSPSGFNGPAGVGFLNGSNTAGAYYLDAVPEPSALVLLTLGGLGLMLSARQRWSEKSTSVRKDCDGPR